jgi:small subunit ribosomal protein S5
MAPERQQQGRRRQQQNRSNRGPPREKVFDKEAWKPKTSLGKKVKADTIKNIDEILDKGMSIMEAEIVDSLLPGLESDLIAVGQSKGKFGGGKRSIWRQTQKKTSEGNKPKFTSVAIVGNKDGYVGLGVGKAKETVPAREKAIRNAKISIIKIVRGCGSWECGCGTPHSIPFKVQGKCGSVIVQLIPAPRGTALCIEKECSKMIRLAGVKDIYAKTFGKSGTKLNLIKACEHALQKLTEMKIHPEYIKTAGIKEGSIQ